MQATFVSETLIYLYVSHKTAHAASDHFSSYFFSREFHNCHEMCSKPCVTTQDFSIESTAFTLISGDISAIGTIYNSYIGITWTIKPIKFEKTCNQLVESKSKKTLAVASYNS